MGVTSRIWMRFQKEKHARWAMHVAEEIIRLCYAPRLQGIPWAEKAAEIPSLSQRYLAYRKELAGLNLAPEHTALEWLRRERTLLFAERCQDIARWDSFEDPEALFPQLCCAYILRFPQVPFTALYRHEMTVSGALLLYRVQYDGTVIHVQEKNGMWPMNEDDWSSEYVYDYMIMNGDFVRKTASD